METKKSCRILGEIKPFTTMTPEDLKHLQDKARKFDKIEALWKGETKIPEGSDIIHELEGIMLD